VDLHLDFACFCILLVVLSMDVSASVWDVQDMIFTIQPEPDSGRIVESTVRPEPELNRIPDI